MTSYLLDEKLDLELKENLKEFYSEEIEHFLDIPFEQLSLKQLSFVESCFDEWVGQVGYYSDYYVNPDFNVFIAQEILKDRLCSREFYYHVCFTQEQKERAFNFKMDLYKEIIKSHYPNLDVWTIIDLSKYFYRKFMSPEELGFMIESLFKEGEDLIYFVGSENPLYIKIGTTTKLKNRIKQLQVGFPRPLLLYGLQKGGREEEKKLHQHFAHLFSNGEWFKATNELKQYITKIEYNQTVAKFPFHHSIVKQINKNRVYLYEKI